MLSCYMCTQVPVATEVLEHVNFELGRPKCDNVLPAIMAKIANYTVEGPSVALRSYTIDTHMRNTSYSSAHQVNGATQYVLISDQWLF
jgi:hypothetical protein